MPAPFAVSPRLLRLAALAAPLAFVPGWLTDAAPAKAAVAYEVSITNLTRGQIMSPPVVATHTADLALWHVGQPASREVWSIAEDAVNQPMLTFLTGNRAVADVQVATGANGPIMPGETAKVVVHGEPGHRDRLSLLGMLVTTNDGFYGVTGAELPARNSELTVPAYDAGSEANTERCSDIPGPPCGNAGVRVTQGAEGYVFVHAGIHGIGDLPPEQFDWRNPVALITVRKL